MSSGREGLDPGPETRLDHSDLLCSKALLKYKIEKASDKHQKGTETMSPC